jgi:hypothetical protein
MKKPCLYLFLLFTFLGAQKEQKIKSFSIGKIHIGQKIDNLENFHKFKLRCDKTSEFDSVYTIPKYYLGKNYGTVYNLELTIEKRRIYQFHFRSGKYTGSKKLKRHFDTTLVFDTALVNNERNKGIAKEFYKSDFYRSKNNEPIYCYISYFEKMKLYHYTDETARLKYRQQKAKENREKYDAD